MYSFSILKTPPLHTFCHVDKEVCQRWLIRKKSATEKKNRYNQFDLLLLNFYYEEEICKLWKINT